MYASHNPLLEYQRQAVASSSPLQLVVKLYDFGIAACHAGDSKRVRSVLVELMAGLDFERGGEIATGLGGLYEYCLTESSDGNLQVVCELLTSLREAWKQILRPPAPVEAGAANE